MIGHKVAGEIGHEVAEALSPAFQDRTRDGGQYPGLHVARGPTVTLQGGGVGHLAEEQH